MLWFADRSPSCPEAFEQCLPLPVARNRCHLWIDYKVGHSIPIQQGRILISRNRRIYIVHKPMWILTPKLWWNDRAASKCNPVPYLIYISVLVVLKDYWRRRALHQITWECGI